ncbi:MAG: hypothetical protein KAI66_12390 [Lentisphaeria bacterium]|nr:hypothetical protein [Lentisphaeria bacterium]
MPHSVSRETLFDEASQLVLQWAKLALPHYGEQGSLDLDLLAFPNAQGPSYYNQFAHWPLLLLATGQLPGATDEERTAFQTAALGNIEYMLGITNAEFLTPHYSRGRDWGLHVGEWSNFFLLQSLKILEAHKLGTEGLRKRLTQSVRGATTRIFDAYSKSFGDQSRTPTAFPSNHAVWHALLCHEAGKHFDEPAWREFAKDFMQRHVLPFQSANGCWEEGGGIVVNYAMVTAQAVSIYAEDANDQQALDAIRRFQSFMTFFALPDGASAVAADCRMHHSAQPMIFLPPTFLRNPQGRADCLARIRGFASALDADTIQTRGAHALAFFTLFPDFLSRHATSQSDTAPLPVSDIPAARLEAGAWTAFLSWQLNPEHRSRFLLDAQNFVELHHSRAGYLVGGGNSKYAPRFSTIRQCNGGRAYIPDNAAPVKTPQGNGVEYLFGAARIRIMLEVEPTETRIAFELVAGADDNARFECAIMLDLNQGDTVTADEKQHEVTPTGALELTFNAAEPTFLWRGIRFHPPTGAFLSYPVIPHNPYRQDGLAETSQYMGRLALVLSAASPRATIRIAEA